MSGANTLNDHLISNLETYDKDIDVSPFTFTYLKQRDNSSNFKETKLSISSTKNKTKTQRMISSCKRINKDKDQKEPKET